MSADLNRLIAQLSAVEQHGVNPDNNLILSLTASVGANIGRKNRAPLQRASSQPSLMSSSGPLPSAKPHRQQAPHERDEPPFPLFISSPTSSNLPPILQSLNPLSYDDEASAFFSDVASLPTHSLYRVLQSRSRSSAPSSRRASSGAVVPALASAALSDGPEARAFTAFSHTRAEARALGILKREEGAKQQEQQREQQRRLNKSRSRSPNREAPPSSQPPGSPERSSSPIRGQFASPMLLTSSSGVAPQVSALRPSSSVRSFDPRDLLPPSSSYHSPYHDLNSPEPLNPDDQHRSRAGTAAGRAQTAAASRRLGSYFKMPASASSLSTSSSIIRPSSVLGITVADENLQELRAERRKLQSRANSLASLERAVHYEELLSIDTYRRALPIKYLASKLLSSSDPTDPANVEVMRVALGKIVMGFQRLIIMYFGTAWERWLDQRDAARREEREFMAKRIQGWYRSLWAKRMVKRKKYEKKLAEEKAKAEAHARHVIELKTALRIQCSARRYFARMKIKTKRSLIEAALRIQRAWARKKVVKKGMGEVTRYWFLQDQAKIIQCAVRCYRARVILGHFKRSKKHAYIAMRFVSTSSVVRTNFEMEGAASRIQRWYCRMPWRILKMYKRLILRTTKQIQRWYRHQKQKRAVIVVLLGHGKKIKARQKAAFKLTPIIRGGIVRLRNKRIKKQAEDAKRKAELEAIEAKRLADHAAEVERRKAEKARKKSFFHRFRPQNINIKIENPLAAKEKHAAVVIQKHMRRCLARKVYNAHLDEKKAKAVAKLQRKFKNYTFKKARWKATLALEQIWMRTLRRRRRKQKAITKVQAQYRAMICRRALIEWKRKAHPAATIMQRYVRGFLRRTKVSKILHKKLWFAEFKMIGAHMYRNTVLNEMRRQIYHHSTHFMVPTHPAELQFIFGHYCSMGQRGNVDRLGVGMFIKLLKESNLITKTLNQQKLELMFTHEKGKDTHLKYPQFITILFAVANIRYATVFKYGYRYKDDQARFLKLVIEDVLEPKVHKDFVKELGDVGVDNRTQQRISKCVSTIQRSYRLSVKRYEWSLKFLAKERVLKEAAMLKALNSIQRSWRCAIARFHLRQFAFKVYQKIIDEHHGGQTYYFNVKTGSATWRKPIFFGKYDIENPIKMPSDDRIYKKTCDYCGKQAATFYDMDDKESFCSDCNEEVHSKGRRANNKCVPYENCVQCEFQLATKWCIPCKDLYCDTCYFDQHKKGRLQRHYYEEVLKHCCECEKFVALLKLDTPQGAQPMCKKCYKKKFPWDKAYQQNNSITGYVVSEYDHAPRAMIAYIDDIEKREAKNALEEEFRIRKKEQDGILREKSSILIQKRLRGWHGRRKGRIIMSQRRHDRLIRRQDQAVRDSFVYKLKLTFGTAQDLPSDTTVEKVMKRFPSWWRDLLTDIVDGDWSTVLKLITEQEKFMQLKQKVPIKEQAKEQFRLGLLELKLLQQKRTLGSITKAADKATAAYKLARSEVGFSETAKEELKMEMRKAKHHQVEQEAKLAELSNEINAKREEIEARKGPRKFWKKIAETRKFGKKMKVRQKPVSWKLETGLDVVFSEDESVDPFAKSFISFGTRLRLGDSSKHGHWYATVIDPKRKPTSVEKFTMALSNAINPKAAEDVEMERKALESWNAKHIKIDRDWVLPLIDEESESAQYVHIMPRELQHVQAKIRFQEAIIRNPFFQFGVAQVFSLYGKVAVAYEEASKKFDEDSPNFAKFKAKAANTLVKQQRILRYTIRKISDDDDAGEKKKNFIVAALLNLKKTATRELRAGITRILKGPQRKKKAVVDLFAKFDASEEKVEIVVYWKDNSDNSKENERLGAVMMDLDAPAGIAREYCRRKLRNELNARCGENFMIVVMGEGMSLDLEASKRIGQLAPQKFNAKTKEVEHNLVLCINPNKDLPKAEIPVIKSFEEIRAEEEAHELFLKSLLCDERVLDGYIMSPEGKDKLKISMLGVDIKEKKIDGLYNKKGALEPEKYNDLTEKLSIDVRVAFMEIIGAHCSNLPVPVSLNRTEKGENMEMDVDGEFTEKKDGAGGIGYDVGDSKADKKEIEEKEAREKVEREKAKKAQEDEDARWEEQEGGEPTADESAPLLEGGSVDAAAYSPWAEYADEAGNPYWYNSESGESTYENPWA